MPKGMYLDARTLGPKKTAKKMSKAIRNRDLYYNFFRFHRYYAFHAAHDNPVTNPICILCATLNDQQQRDERRVYANFTQWWNEIRPRENLKDFLVYYNITNDSSSNNHPKIYVENPNKYATNVSLPEEKDGTLLIQLFDHYFGS